MQVAGQHADATGGRARNSRCTLNPICGQKLLRNVRRRLSLVPSCSFFADGTTGRTASERYSTAFFRRSLLLLPQQVSTRPDDAIAPQDFPACCLYRACRGERSRYRGHTAAGEARAGTRGEGLHVLCSGTQKPLKSEGLGFRV